MPALLLLLTLTGLSLAAQTPPPWASAAATITGVDLIRHVSILAADSMLGRATPSAGLEQSAAYVASASLAGSSTPAARWSSSREAGGAV